MFFRIFFTSLVISFQARDTDGCLTHLLQAVQDQFLPVLFALIKNRLILFCVSFYLPNLDQKILVLWKALLFILLIVFGSTFRALQSLVTNQLFDAILAKCVGAGQQPWDVSVLIVIFQTDDTGKHLRQNVSILSHRAFSV